ncbi:MAG: transposase [Bacilli bacterium]
MGGAAVIDEQIAHNMGVATSTFYEWKKKYPEFSEALKSGKTIVDTQVENALLKKH